LTGLSEEISEVSNIHVSAVEYKDDIVFLHSVADGPASQSYGIQVAQLAGVPKEIVHAAKRELKILESKANTIQPDLFNRTEPQKQELEKINLITKRLSSIKPDELTPKQALDLIYELYQLQDNSEN
jgi:DNA mismatch repair protein MutS